MPERIRARLERAERILSPADPLPVIVVRGGTNSDGTVRERVIRMIPLSDRAEPSER